MASGNESYNPSSYPPEDPRDAVRNPYIAREVLRCPPVGPEHILRTVRADGFSSELGTLLPRGTNYYDFNEAIPAGCVGLLLPNDFTASYGEALEGTRTTTMLGITVQDHLKVPRSHFTAGGAYDHNQLTQHIVLMTKPAWQAMARKTLAVLADSTDGAELLGLRNPTLYRNALANPESVSSQIVTNLLDHAELTERTLANLQQKALASENFEFATHLAAFRSRKGPAQSL